ncbi:MAG: hypothetical protein ABIK86_07570, partial [candidate division WOR-3 bacterium]
LALCLWGLGPKQFPGQPIILDGADDRYARDLIFFSTPVGIYAFNRTTQTWGRITKASGLPDNSVNVLGVDDGILWVATDSGLASADLKLGDWQTYDLPGKVTGLAFDKDYVWAAGRFGLARFDRLTEQWHQVSTLPANDVFSDNDYVWLATDSGLARYSREFNRLEAVAAPPYAYDRIISTEQRIWFVSSQGLVAYRRATAAWSVYRGIEISDYSILGDSLFVVSRGRVVLYEPGSDNWVVFRDIENLAPVNGITASGANLVLATDKGLLIDSLATRTIRTYSVATGLETDTIRAAFQDGQVLFAVTEKAIEFQDRATGIWKVEKLTRADALRQQLVYLDDAGGHLRLIPATDLRLTGRAYHALSRTVTPESTSSTGSRTAVLNLAALHSSNRSLSLYYDDTDKDQVVYGAGYRGTAQDILRRADAGFVESEYSDLDIIPQLSLFGGNARFQYQDHRAGVQAGKLQSRPRIDFFTGRSLDKNLTLPDVNYVRNAFYHVYQPARPLKRTQDTIFIDDHQVLTNKLDTRIGFTVAGIAGDFDPLIRGKGYHIDYDRGMVQFAVPVRPTDLVCLKLGSEELVLQSETVTDHVMENVYALGSGIIPGSLVMTIVDTLGQVHALSEFGLDQDGDNSVDPEFVNCDLGFLLFPTARPFPDVVYTERRRCYTMNLSYRSYSLFYYLSSSPVVRNSEEVLVDGELVQRGSDYTIDYTSGTLVFLKPDIVTDYSEITVRYSSVEREEKSLFWSAQPNVAVAPGLRLSPGFSHADSEDVAHLSGRFETKGLNTRPPSDSGAFPLSLTVIPQFAVNTRGAAAQHHTLTANYQWLSCRVKYEGYAAGFEAFGRQKRKYGDLRHSAAASLGIEPIAQVRLDGSIRREYLTDSSPVTANYTSARLSYLNQNLPNGYLLVGKDMLPDNDKLRLKASLGHEFTVLSTRLKLAGVYQNTAVDPRATDSLAPRARSSEYIADAGFTLPLPVTGSFRLRSNRLSGAQAATQRELRGRLNIDAIPGLYYVGTFNLKGDMTELSDNSGRVPPTRDLSVSSYVFNDLRIAPGRWDPRLAVVNFSAGAGTNFDQYSRNIEAAAPPFRLRPLPGVPVSRVKDLVTMYGSVQLDPWSTLMLRYRRTLNRSGFALYALPELSPSTDDEVRIEYQPPRWGMF